MTGLFLSYGFIKLCAVYSTAALSVGLLASALVRNRPARAHRVMLLAMAAAMVLPVGGAMVQHYGLGVLEAEAEPVVTKAEYEHSDEIVMPVTSKPMVMSETHAPAEVIEVASAPIPDGRKAPIRWRAMLLATWAAASCVLVMRLAAAVVGGYQLVLGAKPITAEGLLRAAVVARERMGMTVHIELRCSGKVSSPVVWSWGRRPILVVHEGYGDGDIDWAGVLCHELAHVRRRDHLAGLAGEILVCVFPWQVLGAVAKRRLAVLAEQACDDWVMACGQASTEYAESLLGMVPQRQTAIVAAVVRSRSGLAARVRRIITERCGNPKVGIRWAVLVSLACAMIGLGAALAQSGPSVAADTLQAAAAGGHVEKVRSSIAAGAEVDGFDISGLTALGHAAAGGHAETVQSLVAAGADVDMQDRTYNTALGYAARGGHRATVEALLAAGASVDTKPRPAQTALGYAAEGGHMEVAKLLLESGADPNAGGIGRRVALHYAVIEGHLDMAVLLVDAGTGLETNAGNAFTALNLAALHGHRAIAEALIAKGADIETTNSWRATPLITAASEGHMEVVRLLVERGAQLDRENHKGNTALAEAISAGHTEVAGYLYGKGAATSLGPLRAAAYFGHVAEMKKLLADGADVNSKDEQGNVPLYYAALGGSSAMVELILSAGVDIDAVGNYKRTILTSMAFKGKTEVVKLLLSKGADVNKRDETGTGSSSAIYCAVMGGHFETAKVLLEHGAEIHEKGYCNVMPLHRAAQQDDGGALTRLLLEHGAEVDCKATTEFTPLHWAAYRDRIESATLLVDHGADVNIKDKTGITALHKAVQGSGETCRVAELLIAKGADIRARSERGYTPLHSACQSGGTVAAKLLLSHGADIQAVDNRGWTPLHFAASSKHVETAAFLIEHRAKVNARNTEGQTPLTLAKEKKNYEAVATLLLQHGATE